MSAATLCLHAGAARVTRDELARYEPPPATATWFPVAHAAALDATVTRLGEAGYAVWHGNYYALEVMNRLGLGDEGAVRAGIVHYNTAEEVDGLLAAIAAL